MTHIVYSFLDGVGRRYTALLYRVAPCAYGAGGSPPLPAIIQYSVNAPIKSMT